MQKHDGNTTFWILTLQIELTLLCTFNTRYYYPSYFSLLVFHLFYSTPRLTEFHAMQAAWKNIILKYSLPSVSVVSPNCTWKLIQSVESCCAPSNFLIYIMHDPVRCLWSNQLRVDTRVTFVMWLFYVQADVFFDFFH